MHRVIGTPEATGQGRFARAHHTLAPGRGHTHQQVLEGAAKLVLRPAPRQRGRLRGDRLGKLLQRVLDRETPGGSPCVGIGSARARRRLNRPRTA